MDLHVELRHNQGREWTRSGGVRAKGFAFHAGAFYSGTALAEFVRALGSDFSAHLPRMRGEFAVVIEHDDGSATAAVDPIRSIPLFYGSTKERAVISDDAMAAARHAGAVPRGDVARLAFLLQGTTLGRQTLLEDVYQIRAGESVRLAGSGFHPVNYFDFGLQSGALEDAPFDSLIEMGIEVIRNAFDRLVRSCHAPLAVPLSGGLDSRLVATMLQRAGRHETVCFTYGSKNSFDAATSQRVATKLGLRWEFVPYTHLRWYHWARSAEYDRYRRFASQTCTIEHEQDWPAVFELRSRNALAENSVIVPGHSGDFLAGSHLPAEAFSSGPDTAVDWAFHKYLNLWPVSAVPSSVLHALRAQVKGTLAPGETAARQFDDYGWRHRQSMMIVNSVRAYEHHGFDWRLPLWDADMISFWSSVPIVYRRGKRLYLEVLKRILDGLMDVPYTPPAPGPAARIQARISDHGLYRMGIFCGRSGYSRFKPLATLFGNVDDLSRQVTKPWRRLPIAKARVNGLLALGQLQDTIRRIEAEGTDS